MTDHAIDAIQLDSLEHLSWMRGLWVEQYGDRRCEEIWSGPDADTMMGMFRWANEGEVSFFEFMTIRLSDTAVELHAKHFHPTLVAWEDRQLFQAFVLTEYVAGKAVFAAQDSVPEQPGPCGGWLVYERVSEDRLDVQLIEATGDVKLTFHFQRQR